MLDVFERAPEQEQAVTNYINVLYALTQVRGRLPRVAGGGQRSIDPNHLKGVRHINPRV